MHGFPIPKGYIIITYAGRKEWGVMRIIEALNNRFGEAGDARDGRYGRSVPSASRMSAESPMRSSEA